MSNRITKAAATVGLAIILITGATARLDASDEKGVSKELTIKNFEYSLTWNEYPGIVESTVYNIVICKSRFPGLNYSELAGVLKQVAEENNNPAIRYKAQLAYMYLNFSSTIDLIPGETSPNDVFKEISEKLEQKFLASQTTQ
jgi:hypothetical protein